VEKSKVISPDSKGLPNQNTPGNLAAFDPEFGILKIGRKIKKGGHPAAFSFGGWLAFGHSGASHGGHLLTC
jgi:hypothetical protein